MTITYHDIAERYLAERNYIDWSQVRANAPRTPELIG